MSMDTFDPTLQLPQNDAPGGGVPGKMPGDSDHRWGTPSENDTSNHLPTLDISQETLSSTPLPKEPRGGAARNKVPGAQKNLSEFYETPTDLLTFEERSLVDPKVLSRQLLSRVDYKAEFGASMVEFFLSKAKYRVTLDTHYYKNGEMYEKERHIPNSPPMFSEFGRTIGVSERTLKSWAKKHPEFQEAYEICQDIITEFFVENGVKGDYASQFAIFAAKNMTKMKDVVVNKNENYDMKAVLDAIEKGTIESQ